MKVWISKFALSKGIFQMEVNHTSDDGDVVHGEHFNECFYGEGKQWHKTEEEAKARAEELRKKKIANLKNQIQKLEEMKF
jgi:hypothetical protein